MNYVTTNIRISEEDYLRLKTEAARQRKSLSAVIREKIGNQEKRTPAQIAKILKETKMLAKKNSKYSKNVDGVTLIREMRYKGKW